MEQIACLIIVSLYANIHFIFGQESFKIRSKEMIHNVEEAQKEALKTVERFASQKNNRLTFKVLHTCEGLLSSCTLVLTTFYCKIESRPTMDHPMVCIDDLFSNL